MYEYLCIVGLIVFFLVLGFLIYVSCKKYFLEVFPNEDVNSFRQKLTQLFLNKKWNVEEKKGRIHVESGSFTAVDLHFKQNGQNVEIYYVSSATGFAWVLIILGIFLLTILTIIVALVADSNSRSFAKNIIHPILIKTKERGFEDINYDLSITPRPLSPEEEEIKRKNTIFNVIIIVGLVVSLIGFITASVRITEYTFWGFGFETSYPYLYPGVIIGIIGVIVMLTSLILKLTKKKTY
jgi:hypothetical protein